jgi:hypothetical protein
MQWLAYRLQHHVPFGHAVNSYMCTPAKTHTLITAACPHDSYLTFPQALAKLAFFIINCIYVCFHAFCRITHYPATCLIFCLLIILYIYLHKREYVSEEQI